MLNIQNDLVPIRSIYSIAVLFILLFHFNLSAQIGSIGGFNNISLSYKNDLVLSAGTNFSQSLNYEEDEVYDNFKIYDTQIAYAFFKYLGIQAGYQRFILFNDEELNLCESIGCKQSNRDHYFNAAISAFYTFDLKKISSKNKNTIDSKLTNKAHILLNAYVGYGKGINKLNIINRFNWLWYSGYIMHFDNYYFQPDFMFNGRFIGGGFSAFYSIIKFNKIILLNTPIRDIENLVSNIEEHPTARVYGLNLKIWAGVKQIKLVYNINRKYILNNNLLNSEHSKTHNNYSHLISLQLNLIDLFK